MTTNNYKNYLEDALLELISRANHAKNNYIENKNDFNAGILHGYYESISYLLNQMDIFRITKEFNADIIKFNPDSLIDVE